MDPRIVDELLDVIIGGILSAEVVCKVQQQLTTQNLIPMHVGDVLELRFHWKF
jgi:hypothetical protein